MPKGAWDVDSKTAVEKLGLTEMKTTAETFEDLVAQMLEREKA